MKTKFVKMLLTCLIFASAAFATSSRANDWGPWRVLNDGVHNGIDIRYAYGTDITYFQFRNRYSQTVSFTATLTVDNSYTDPDYETNVPPRGITSYNYVFGSITYISFRFTGVPPTSIISSGGGDSTGTDGDYLGLGAYSPPVISGSCYVGDLLTTSNGDWVGGEWNGTILPLTFEYTWYHNSVADLAGATDIGTASSYAINALDVNKFICVQVRAKDGVGSGSSTSTWVQVKDLTPVVVTAPSINVSSNPCVVGSTLTATQGTWTGGPLNYTYSWQRASDAAGTGSVEIGKNASYVVTTSEAHKFIRMTVTGTNNFGSALSISTPWFKVSNSSPTISSGPTASLQKAFIGDTVLFNCNATDLDGDTCSLAWNFGDGTTGQGSSPPHAFTLAGVYFTTVTIIDNFGGSVQARISINVTPLAPNLLLSKYQYWSDKIIVSNTTNATNDASPLQNTDTLFASCSILNNGRLPLNSSFDAQLFVDNVFVATTTIARLMGINEYYLVHDINLGSLTSGSHVITIKLDTGNTVSESDETDNIYSKTITVQRGPANLVPYQPSGWSDKIVVSNQSGVFTDSSVLMPTDTLYVSLAGLNNGGTAIPSGLVSQLYVDNVLKYNLTTTGVLNPGDYLISKSINMGQLTAGAHTISFSLDSGNNVSESNESDNTYTKTVIIGVPNLVPYKAPNWSGPLVVSNKSGVTTNGTALKSTDTLYVHFCYANVSATVPTKASFLVQVLVDGVVIYTYTQTSPLGWFYVPSNELNIGKLTAGTHTLSLVVDPANSVAESNESDNTYTKTITIAMGRPQAKRSERSNAGNTLNSVSATPNVAKLGQSIDFLAAVATRDGTSPVLNWDFGDGSSTIGSSPSHTYAAPGTYTATVTTDNGNGGIETSHVTVSVQ